MTDQPPSASLKRPIESTFWSLLVIAAVAATAALVLVVVTWVPDHYKCLPCTYSPEKAKCYGVSRANPLLEGVCGYEGKTMPCDLPITTLKPRQCFGIIR